MNTENNEDKINNEMKDENECDKLQENSLKNEITLVPQVHCLHKFLTLEKLLIMFYLNLSCLELIKIGYQVQQTMHNIQV